VLLKESDLMSQPAKNKSSQNRVITLILFLAASIGSFTNALADLGKFCEGLPRPAYGNFEKSDISTDWFEVYEVETDVWAIYEPFQWQEVISYLIIGSDSALLFDTGNGMGDIRSIVDQLTDKPVQVVNSHSHFDHIGGNYQFEEILSPSTNFSVENSRGNDSQQIKMEASAEALCKGLPAGVTRESHRIRPYTITAEIKDGDVIDLGSRNLEVLRIPGHTDDSIALLDRDSGLLWTGDSFYEGPIWLFFPETDLAAYETSLARLVSLVPRLKALFPAHNIPKSRPSMLVETQKALELVLQGKAKPVPTWEGVVTFEFEGFGFLMREDYTTISED
jgi:glyoxylase-like metal-dependent hydrolase (beta-lactamase superfamily II)